MNNTAANQTTAARRRIAPQHIQIQPHQVVEERGDLRCPLAKVVDRWEDQLLRAAAAVRWEEEKKAAAAAAASAATRKRIVPEHLPALPVHLLSRPEPRRSALTKYIDEY